MLFEKKIKHRFLLGKYNSFFYEIYRKYKENKLDSNLVNIIKNEDGLEGYLKLFIEKKGFDKLKEEFLLMLEEINLIGKFLLDKEEENLNSKQKKDKIIKEIKKENKKEIKIELKDNKIILKRDGKIIKILNNKIIILENNVSTVFDGLESIFYKNKKYIFTDKNIPGAETIIINDKNLDEYKEIIEKFLEKEN